MSQIEYNKQIEVRYEVDVFVAGGGSAGVAAAVTAVRQGRSVFLAEGHSCLGGMGTAGLVPLFMQFGDGEHFLADGLGREVFERVLKAGGRLYREKYLAIPSEKLKRIYDDMVVSNSVCLSLQTLLVGVVQGDKGIEYAVCRGSGGLFAVRARAYVDCTGNGDLAAEAGAEFEIGDKQGAVMPSTLCSIWANIDWEKAGDPTLQEILILLDKAFRDKVFTVEDRHHSGMAQTGVTLGSANIGHIFDFDPLDEMSVTSAYVAGRKYLPEYEHFYKHYVKGFAKAELVSSASLLGIRESRRVIGDYVLSSDDYFARRQFADQVGGYCYEIDIHPGSSDQSEFARFTSEIGASKYKPGEYYGIPYRCLTARGIDNLWVAGRCLSADKIMQSSLRVMPGCFITGQAAGMAASLAVAHGWGTKQVDVPELQRKLGEAGAFLGV